MKLMNVFRWDERSAGMRHISMICVLGAVISALVLSGCSSVPTPQSVFSELTPRAGYARLYLYREKKFIGMAAKPTVTIDGVKVGMLRNGSYLAVYLAPGKHDIKTEFSLLYAPLKGSTAPVEVAADQDLFVRFNIDMTNIIPMPHFVYSEWQTGFDIPDPAVSRTLIESLTRTDTEPDVLLRTNNKAHP